MHTNNNTAEGDATLQLLLRKTECVCEAESREKGKKDKYWK